MKKSNFKMLDENFTCLVCGESVEKLGYSARNHCPNCLHSIHLDINPGDRESHCYGIMKPVNIELDKKTEYKIVFKCIKCGEIKRNKTANDDNFDKMLKIMSNVNK